MNAVTAICQRFRMGYLSEIQVREYAILLIDPTWTALDQIAPGFTELL
jgi:hypothetical protein